MATNAVQAAALGRRGVESAFPTLVTAIYAGCITLIVFALVSPAAAVIALGISLFPFLAMRPRDTLWLAPTFMILAVNMIPQTYVLTGEGTPPEFYYWAIGLFLITLPLVARILFQRQWSIFPKHRPGVRAWPPALLAFIAVSVASAMEGLRGGYDPSYVSRQFYGVVLFFVYFMGALAFIQDPDEITSIIRRVRRFALLGCVVAFYWYFEESFAFVLFKQHLVTYSVSLAVFSLAEFLSTSSPGARFWLVVQTLVLILPAVLARSRGALGVVFIVAIAGLGLVSASRIKRIALVGAAAVLLILGITADLFAPVADLASRVELLNGVIPESVQNNPSYLGRLNQMHSAIEVVKQHPLLGGGLGSTLTFYQTGADKFQTEHLVDHGYAYLLSKFGLLGVLAFAALIFSLLRQSGWPSKDANHLGLLMVLLFNLLYMMNGPIWLHFLTAAWVGVSAGLLYRLGVFRAEGLAAKQGVEPSAGRQVPRGLRM